MEFTKSIIIDIIIRFNYHIVANENQLITVQYFLTLYLKT